MKPYEINGGGLLISDDKARLDRLFIHRFLSRRSYWAADVAMEVVNRSIEHSLCLGLYKTGRQIGFARAVTDFATFAWLADVFIADEERGFGYGKKLVGAILAHPDLQGLRRIVLGTRDAHTLYGQFGFTALKYPERFMEMVPETRYKSGS